MCYTLLLNEVLDNRYTWLWVQIHVLQKWNLQAILFVCKSNNATPSKCLWVVWWFCTTHIISILSLFLHNKHWRACKTKRKAFLVQGSNDKKYCIMSSIVHYNFKAHTKWPWFFSLSTWNYSLTCYSSI